MISKRTGSTGDCSVQLDIVILTLFLEMRGYSDFDLIFRNARI
jgi:hypothetical protein